MTRYLAEDCYCPGEIYDISGFFYLIFKAEDECRIFAKSDDMTALVANERDKDRPQALLFWHDDPENPGRIIAAQRVDATENNIGILRDIVRGAEPDGRKLDEFKKGSTAKALKEVFAIADGIICD